MINLLVDNSQFIFINMYPIARDCLMQITLFNKFHVHSYIFGISLFQQEPVHCSSCLRNPGKIKSIIKQVVSYYLGINSVPGNDN